MHSPMIFMVWYRFVKWIEGVIPASHLWLWEFWIFVLLLVLIQPQMRPRWRGAISDLWPQPTRTCWHLYSVVQYRACGSSGIPPFDKCVLSPHCVVCWMNERLESGSTYHLHDIGTLCLCLHGRQQSPCWRVYLGGILHAWLSSWVAWARHSTSWSPRLSNGYNASFYHIGLLSGLNVITHPKHLKTLQVRIQVN